MKKIILLEYIIKMKTVVMYFFIASILLFTGCTTKNDRLFQNKNSNGVNDKKSIVSDADYKKEINYEYTIAPNDRLSIMIYIQSGAGSKQMNSILTSRGINRNMEQQGNIGILVTQKGTVRLPLIGIVNVIGLTQDELSALLIQKYEKYIRSPYVTVEIINQRVIVVGEVKKPGIVPVVNGTLNLLEVIARSGDMTDLAERTNIKIIRGDLRDPQIRVVDLTQIENIKTTSLLLKPNDIVYVQARHMKGINKAVREISPFFVTLANMLQPLVQRKTIIGDVSE